MNPLADVRPTPAPTVAERVATWLDRLRVELAFGVSGGGVAPLWGALSRSPGLRLLHTQHESGAAFAATEASLASRRPVVVFTTTGPGLTNALTGIVAARTEGAHVLLLSGATPTERRLRGATQETGPSGEVDVASAFDLSITVETEAMLATALRRIEAGMQQEGGFVAHLAVPMDVQGLPTTKQLPPAVSAPGPQASEQDLIRVAADLRDKRCVLVAGFHARHHGEEVRQLAERLGAPVVTTPRALGVVPADHPSCLGVVGFAGHDDTLARLAELRPEVVLAVGTALSEGASQWHDALVPSEQLVLVHPRPDAVAGLSPDVPTTWLRGSVASTLQRLVAALPHAAPPPTPRPHPTPVGAPRGLPVSPVDLLDSVQRVVIDGSDTLVLAEAGNSFAWAIHQLQLPTPRLRVSVRWGSMGHATAGVLGAALGSRGRALALVGDGAMLMLHELATAASHDVDATWVVLNDGGMGMCRQGVDMLGISGIDADLAPVRFAAMAAALGVPSRVVEGAEQLDDVLRWAVRGTGPKLVEVPIDRGVTAPIGARVAALTWAGEASP